MAQLGALLRRRAEAERAADYRAGLLAALLFNANRGPNQRPKRPEDFFPSLIERSSPRQMSGAEMLTVCASIAGVPIPPEVLENG